MCARAILMSRVTQTFFLLLVIYTASRCIPPTAGWQREPIVEKLRSPFTAKFWSHCVLNSGAQRHALPQRQSEVMKI